MTRLLVAALLLSAPALFSADAIGTWKLNTAKSKYTNMPQPKELIVVYTAEGNGMRYESKGTSETGEPISGSFVYVKDGEEAKATGFPMFDSMVLTNGMTDKSTAVLKREGKEVGVVTRTISADGKTMTIQGEVTTPDGKKATYVAVYEKQ